MPVKNALPYLEECLNSIINQTHKNWELLAVNDHSDDESNTVLQNYSEIDSRIKVYQNAKVGIIPALQTSYLNSKGSYITRMDADDIMPEYKLDTMFNELKKHDDMSLVTGYVKYFSADGIQNGFKRYEDWLNGLVDNNNHYNEIYKECVIPSPCWMTTRTAFEKIGGFNSEIYPEDYDLTFRFQSKKIKIVGIPKLLHLWRDHQTRTSRTHENYAVNSFLNLKIYYFLKLNYNSKKQLVIWGAGKKGKSIAQLLNKNNIPFEWICNNPNKIGLTFEGSIWQDSDSYFNDLKEYQIISVVSKPEDQNDIKNQIKSFEKIEDFWFS